jgi:hypothetical protein
MSNISIYIALKLEFCKKSIFLRGLSGERLNRASKRGSGRLDYTRIDERGVLADTAKNL